jgi:hypothetical protein
MPRALPARPLAPLVLALACLAGCSSSNSTTGPSGNSYYLRFKANGTQVEFTSEPSLIGAFAQSGIQYNGLFTGYDANSNMSLQVFDGAAITQKSYSGYDITGGALVGVLLTYQTTGGVVYGSGGVGTDAVITITELSQTAVKGTFTGTMKASGHPNLSITQGEFVVHRAN